MPLIRREVEELTSKRDQWKVGLLNCEGENSGLCIITRFVESSLVSFAWNSTHFGGLIITIPLGLG
jgi:hypothetical protein